MTFSPLAMSFLNSDTLLRCKVRTKGMRHIDGHFCTVDTNHYFFITNHTYAARTGSNLSFMMGLFCKLVSGLAKSTVGDWETARWYNSIQKHLDRIDILTEPKLSRALFFPLLPGQPPASLQGHLKRIWESLGGLRVVLRHCTNSALKDELQPICIQLFDRYDAILLVFLMIIIENKR